MEPPALKRAPQPGRAVSLPGQVLVATWIVLVFIGLTPQPPAVDPKSSLFWACFLGWVSVRICHAPVTGVYTTWLMESGQFSRGRETIRADGGLVLVGNFDVHGEHQQRVGRLFGPLPPEMPCRYPPVTRVCGSGKLSVNTVFRAMPLVRTDAPTLPPN